jgi:RNA 3'-terminal phosphate cyclase (ATP)
MPEPPVRIRSLDGAGQALRAAVALSVATGRGFVVERVVSGRVHPGSHSQNLTVVKAAAQVCGARVYGNDLHSSTLVFEPGSVVAGDYTFDVGGASSAVLLMQVIYLPLVLAGAPSTLVVNGGTHVPFSPPFPYLEDAWLPMLAAMEIEVDLALVKPGFFPRGGGTLRLATRGTGIQGTLRLGAMGELDGVTIRSITGNLPFHVGERQLDHAIDFLKEQRIAAVGGTETVISEAPGTVLQLVGYFSSGQRLVCSALGKKGESAEEVAEIACREFLDLLETECNVDSHLADQLLLPLALASEDGEYVAPTMTADLEESADIVNAFLPDRIELEPLKSGAVRIRNRR